MNVANTTKNFHSLCIEIMNEVSSYHRIVFRVFIIAYYESYDCFSSGSNIHIYFTVVVSFTTQAIAMDRSRKS